jgi:hypothetical protein
MSWSNPLTTRALLRIAALIVAALAFAPPVSGQRPSRVEPRARAAAIDPMRHLHREATAFGRIDLARLRAFRHFRRIVRYGVQELDAPTRAISRVRALLEHTDAVYVSLVRGPGRTAELATVLLHGTYGPNEVPGALQSILPGILAGLWAETRIDGLPAYDVGVGALVRLSDRDWLIARRIGADLPVTPREPPPALATAEYRRLEGLAQMGQSVAAGVLVGGEGTDSARQPPGGLGFLYHQTRGAYGHLAIAEAAEARFSFEMTGEAGATSRADYFRGILTRIQQNILDAQGEGGAPMRFAVERRGPTVDISVTLDPAQVDAYVARFLTGGLLSARRTEEEAQTSPATVGEPR